MFSSDEGVRGGSIPIPLLGPAALGTGLHAAGDSPISHRDPCGPCARSAEQAPEACEHHEPLTEK